MQTDSQTITEVEIDTHAVSRLELTHFRNYSHTQLDVGASSVVLYGPNGAGKTNILEAISLLAPGRGFRRARLSDMDGSNGPWTIFAEANGNIGEVNIGTARLISSSISSADNPLAPIEITQGENSMSEPAISLRSSASCESQEIFTEAKKTEKRIVRIDGQPIKSPNQLSEYLSILWLTPTSDQLFLEGGTARRKFLDRLVYGFDPAHATRINRYEKAMRERNRLLATPGAHAAWFESIEAQMAEIGTAISFARQQAVEHINAVMQLSELSFPKAHLALYGVIEQAVQQGMSAAEVEELYRDKLAEHRPADQQNARSSIGVNRTELLVTHQGKNAEAARCSTGEQKALLLAIILAEVRAAALWHNRTPILLLDEVAAHLDPEKRAELYQEIQELKVQVWMSGVSRDLFEEMLGNVSHFRVENGQVI